MQEEVTSLNDSVSSGFLNGSIKEQIMAELLPQINNTKAIKEQVMAEILPKLNNTNTIKEEIVAEILP